MRKRIFTSSILGTLLAASLGFAQNSGSQPLTNDNVIRMVQSGVPTEIIIKTIRAADTFHFSLLPNDLIALGQAKVPDDVIKAIAARINNAAPAQSAPADQTAPTAAVVKSVREVKAEDESPYQPSVQQTPLREQPLIEPGVTPSNKPRVFLQASSHGNNWNAHRDQSMEMSKDFEKNCPDVRITLNPQMADYTVLLNHIEHGFVRDNQFQVADKNGDLLTKTKEGGSINGGVKKACSQILDDWASRAK